jgi:hypothetical protein
MSDPTKEFGMDETRGWFASRRHPVNVGHLVMGLAFAGLVVVGAMAMLMYELFSYIEKHTTAWAHRGSQGQ